MTGRPIARGLQPHLGVVVRTARKASQPVALVVDEVRHFLTSDAG